MYANEAIQTRATVHLVFVAITAFHIGKTTAKYLSKAKVVRVMIEQAIDDPCERRSSLREVCPKRPSFTHEWMPRNILIVVGIILQMALKIVLFGPTVFGWLGFLRFHWEKAVHWLVWLLNFFNQLILAWLKWLKTIVSVR